MSEWIKCSERMPESELQVLAFGDNPLERVGFQVLSFEQLEDKWWNGGEGLFQHKDFVTHWMPLPPAPEKETERQS